MLTFVIGPGKYGINYRAAWNDGEPVPEQLGNLPPDTVVDFRANGRELELILHAINADDEYLKRTAAPNPLPGAAGATAEAALTFVIVGMLAASAGADEADRARILTEAEAIAAHLVQHAMAVTP